MPLRPLQAELFSFAATKLESDADLVAATAAAGETIPHCSRDGAASILKFGVEIKNRCRLWIVSGEILVSILKFGPEIKNHCTQKVVFGEILTSILKSGPEIKNRCTQQGINRQNLAAIRKSGPEIKNRCTLEGLNGEKLASIPKFGFEIKNRGTKQPILQHAFHHALTTRLALDILHGHGLDSGGKSGC